MGVKSPAADAMIGACSSPQTRDDFVAAARALDRVLISGQYVMPLFNAPNDWLARWPHRAAAVTPLPGDLPETWWRSRKSNEVDVILGSPFRDKHASAEDHPADTGDAR